MENKDWREQLKNLCKMQNIGISPNGGYIQELWYQSSQASLESLIEMILNSKQEEIKKVKFNRYDEYGDFCEEVVGLDDIIKILK